MEELRYTTGWGKWVVELYEAEVGDPFPFTAVEIATFVDTEALQKEILSDPKTFLVSLACELARNHTQDDSAGPNVYMCDGEYFDYVIVFIRQYGWFKKYGGDMASGPLSAVFAHLYQWFTLAKNAGDEPESTTTITAHPLLDYEYVASTAFTHTIKLMCGLAKMELGDDVFTRTNNSLLMERAQKWTGKNMMA